MKIIKASNTGLPILVDDEDFAILSRFTWHTTIQGYAQCKINGKNMLMHRFILNYNDKKVIDHIDHNKINNQKSNLRIVGQAINTQNVIKKSKTGFRGVFFESGSYKAGIRKEGKRIHLGVFKNILDAALAYDKAAIELYGPDALTNKKILKKIFDL